MVKEFTYDIEPDEKDGNVDWVRFDDIVPEFERTEAVQQLFQDYDEPIEVRWAGLTVAKVTYL